MPLTTYESAPEAIECLVKCVCAGAAWGLRVQPKVSHDGAAAASREVTREEGGRLVVKKSRIGDA